MTTHAEVRKVLVYAMANLDLRRVISKTWVNSSGYGCPLYLASVACGMKPTDLTKAREIAETGRHVKDFLASCLGLDPFRQATFTSRFDKLVEAGWSVQKALDTALADMLAEWDQQEAWIQQQYAKDKGE